MTSPFDRLDAMASRSVDWMNAETFTLTPMRSDAHERAGPDDTRPVVIGRGVFTDTPADNAGIQLGRRRSYGGSNNDLATARPGRRVELSVDRTIYFPMHLPVQGDRLEIRGRSFIVSSVQPDGHSRVVLQLTGGSR